MVLDSEQQANIATSLAAGAVGGLVGVGLRSGRRGRVEALALICNGAIVGALFAAGVEWQLPGRPQLYVFVACGVSLTVSRWGERSLLWIFDVVFIRARRLARLWVESGQGPSARPIDSPDTDEHATTKKPATRKPSSQDQP